MMHHDLAAVGVDRRLAVVHIASVVAELLDTAFAEQKDLDSFVGNQLAHESEMFAERTGSWIRDSHKFDSMSFRILQGRRWNGSLKAPSSNEYSFADTDFAEALHH